MKLDHYLKTHQISRRAFAEKIGMSVSAVNHWINEIRRPEDDIKRVIAEATEGAVMPNDWIDLSKVFN